MLEVIMHFLIVEISIPLISIFLIIFCFLQELVNFRLRLTVFNLSQVSGFQPRLFLNLLENKVKPIHSYLVKSCVV